MREKVPQTRQHLFGKTPIGRDLAAIDRQERRFAIALVQDQFIIATDILGLARAIVIKRAHAGKRPNDVGGADLGAEIFIRDPAQIIDLLATRRRR